MRLGLPKPQRGITWTSTAFLQPWVNPPTPPRKALSSGPHRASVDRTAQVTGWPKHRCSCFPDPQMKIHRCKLGSLLVSPKIFLFGLHFSSLIGSDPPQKKFLWKIIKERFHSGRFSSRKYDNRERDLDRPGFESKRHLYLLRDFGHVIKLSFLVCKTEAVFSLKSCCRD